MRNVHYYSLVAFLIMIQSIGIAQDTESFNVLSIPNGAFILKAPNTFKTVPETSNKIVPWTKEALIDGTNTKGWSSAKGTSFPMEFVFELSEPCIIEKIGFNTQCEKQYKGISAKGIKIEFSTESHENGYKTIDQVKLKDQQPTKYFETENAPARWIKISILSNNGFSGYTELMEIEAIGRYANENPPKVDLTGDWASSWGLASIRQTGSKIQGCYEYRNGIIENAGIDRRIVTYKWVEQGQNGIGRAVLVVNSEGNRLNGIWGFGDDLKTYGLWVFRKKSDQPSLCYTQIEDKAQVQQEIDVNIQRMKTELETAGKLMVYGINFETNSDVIKEESYPTLDELYELLIRNVNLNLYIEGHTDDRGSESYNLELSEKRANSVKTYIVDKGVDTQRLTAVGRGEQFPIADNNSTLGRSANRRVELRPR